MTPPERETMRAPIAVGSWSLRPSSPADLARMVRECGLDAIQLDLRPFGEAERAGSGAEDWTPAGTARALEAAGVRIVSGMIGLPTEDYTTPATIRETGGVRPDGAWPDNLARVRRMADAAAAMGVGLVSMHAGFLPARSAGRDGERDDTLRDTMLDRVREVAAALRERGVSLILETGQETAEDLREALEDLAPERVGVNFDPANMILYGAGAPVAGFRALAPWVRQLHLKDALPARTRGAWGTEVPLGRGAVDWDGLLRAAEALTPGVGMAIEREAGEQRVRDVREGAAFLRDMLARRGGAS